MKTEITLDDKGTLVLQQSEGMTMKTVITVDDKGTLVVHQSNGVLHPVTPIPAVGIGRCDPLRTELAALRARLKQIRKFERQEDGERPRLNEEWSEASTRVEKARLALQACEAPFKTPTPPPTPAPVTLALTRLVCLDQSDDIRLFLMNVEDDEPYVVIFAVDLRTTSVVPLPSGALNSKMTLVGPLEDMDLEDRAAPPNVIWGLSNAPELVSSANDLIVLVAMMENDSSSPAQVRTVLETAARAALVANLPSFTTQQIPRHELVSRIIAGMAGSMGLAKVGAPDPDDNIGAIQELRFFQFELDDLYRSGRPLEKHLVFEGDDAKYVLKFTMFR